MFVLELVHLMTYSNVKLHIVLVTDDRRIIAHNKNLDQ